MLENRNGKKHVTKETVLDQGSYRKITLLCMLKVNTARQKEINKNSVWKIGLDLCAKCLLRLGRITKHTIFFQASSRKFWWGTYFDLFMSWLKKGLPLFHLIARKYLTFVIPPASTTFDQHDLEEKRREKDSDIHPPYSYGMKEAWLSSTALGGISRPLTNKFPI